MTEVSAVSIQAAIVSAGPATDSATETAREFEALFLSQSVDEMLRTVPAGIMGGGHAEEMWRSFLARAIAEEIAGSDGAGIARSVETAIAGYGRATQEGE